MLVIIVGNHMVNGQRMNRIVSIPRLASIIDFNRSLDEILILDIKGITEQRKNEAMNTHHLNINYVIDVNSFSDISPELRACADHVVMMDAVSAEETLNIYDLNGDTGIIPFTFNGNSVTPFIRIDRTTTPPTVGSFCD